MNSQSLEIFVQEMTEDTRIQIVKDYEHFRKTGVVDLTSPLRTKSEEIFGLSITGMHMTFVASEVHRYYTLDLFKASGILK